MNYREVVFEEKLVDLNQEIEQAIVTARGLFDESWNWNVDQSCLATVLATLESARNKLIEVHKED